MENNRKIKRTLLSIVLAVLTVLELPSQTRFTIDSQTIDQFVKIQMDRWKVPGCAIAIVDGRQVLFAKGYGLRDVENQLPATPGTVFKIASCTKSFTAATAGLLVAQRKLDWDKPLIDYLPQLKFSDKALTGQVTLRDLLTHRTGIYDDDWSWVGEHIDEKRMYEILAAMPVRLPFRTGYIYSNMAYALAGQLVAYGSQDSWRNVIRKNFLEPLAMQSTVFSHNEYSGLADYAFGYEWADSSHSYVRGNLSEHFTDSLSVCEAFGFISSSALDLSRWVRMFINCGYWQGKQLIPQDVFRELVKPVNYINRSSDTEITESYYCMGWIKNYYKGHPLLQHSGGLSGFKSYMSFMPQDSIGIVVLTNGQPYRFPQGITYDLYDLVMGLGPSVWSNKWLPKQVVAEADAIKAAINILDTKPSKPLPEYAGLYHNQWLGDMRVSYDVGALYFQFHQYPKEKMRHAHFDTFFTEAEREPGTGITFQLSHDGRINALLLNEFRFEKTE